MSTERGAVDRSCSGAVVELGRVVKPHGLRGEVKVWVHWAPSEVLLGVPTVSLRRDGEAGQQLAVLEARRSGRFVLLRLGGIDRIEAADAWRGAAVEVPRDALPELDPGEYYLCDLVGARVIGPDGLVGHVESVHPYPTVDAIVVRMTDGRVAEQPLAAPWLSHVDIAGGCVMLSSTDGLVE